MSQEHYSTAVEAYRFVPARVERALDVRALPDKGVCTILVASTIVISVVVVLALITVVVLIW